MTAWVNSRHSFIPYRPILLLAFGLLLTSHATESRNPSSPVAQETSLKENKIPRAAKAILEHADKFEVLSLSPGLARKPEGNTFYGYRILGSTVIADAEIQKRLVSAFEQGVTENDGVAMLCFNPRHGISVTSRGHKEDFVICFQCRQVEVHGAIEGEFLISDTPKPIFDQALRDANVSLPETE